MKKKRTMKTIFLKVILPLGVLFTIAATVLMHRGNMNAELPVDYNPDPWPLEGCKIEPEEVESTTP